MDLVTPGIGLVFWMLLAFLILLFLLRKFAWKPILGILDERQKTIDDALKAADKAKEEMTKLQADNERIIKEARAERDTMIRQARETKDKMIAEAKDEAQKESNKIVEAARQAIDSEKQAAVNEIKNQMASISVSIAEKILQLKLQDNKEQQDLVKKLLKDLKIN